MPVEGFEVPSGATDVVHTHIDVDPRYTLETHKGTGYYKVPSLREFGIGALSGTTVPPRPSKTGLMQPVSIRDMFRLASRVATERLVRFQGIASGSIRRNKSGRLDHFSKDLMIGRA